MTVGGNEPIRVVIDTSILVPILTYESPSSNWLVRMWQSGLMEPLACDETPPATAVERSGLLVVPGLHRYRSRPCQQPPEAQQVGFVPRPGQHFHP